MYGTNTELSKQYNWAASEVQFVRLVLPGLLLLTSRGMFRNAWTGKLENPSMGGSHFMSMFNDIAWTKRGNIETRLHYAKEVAARATNFKPGH